MADEPSAGQFRAVVPGAEAGDKASMAAGTAAASASFSYFTPRKMDPNIRATLQRFQARRAPPPPKAPVVTYLYQTVGVQTDDPAEDETGGGESDEPADAAADHDDALALLGTPRELDRHPPGSESS